MHLLDYLQTNIHTIFVTIYLDLTLKKEQRVTHQALAAACLR